MKLRKTPIALAALSLCGALPLAAQAAPSVSFRSPDDGQRISGNLYQSSACEAAGSGIERVQFYLDGTALNTEYNGPWTCNLDTRRFSDGRHRLRAVAYDSRGDSSSAEISVEIANGGGPSVSFRTPQSGQTISGSFYQSAECEVAGDDIDRVDFFLDGTRLNSEGGAPWNCNLDTTRFADGGHTLKAVAYDSSNRSATAQVAVTISNGSGGDDGGSSDGGSSDGGGSDGGSTGSGPSLSFKSPADGQTVSGSFYQASGCEVAGSGIEKVEFFLDSTRLNSEGNAPWTCNLDTTKFADGSHTLKAVAYDSANRSSAAQIAINIANNSSGDSGGGDSGGSDGGGSGGGDQPTVSFKSPSNGATISGSMHQESACEALVASTNGMKQVEFFLDATRLNTEGNAPWTCNLDTTKFPDGAHTLKAVATDDAGASGAAQIAVTIRNGSGGDDGGSDGGGSVDGLSVSFKTPSSGQTLSGSFYQSSGCEVAGSGIAKVEFFLDSTRLNTEQNAPWTCNLDTTKFADGSHTLKAVAYDSSNRSSAAQVGVQIANRSSGGNDSGGNDSGGGDEGPVGSLPSTNTRAIATFESLGLYWKPPSNPGAAGCSVRYRKTGDASWKQGYPMWYDSRNAECRGSLVRLSPGTEYEVQFAMPGKPPSAALKARTWSESFPIAKTVKVPSGSSTLKITQGGTKDGYVLYTGPATLDANKGQDYNVTISAPYVIVRGLTLKGAKVDAIRLLEGAHDVVIEGNDISDWGTYRYTNPEGWKIGLNAQAGIAAWCRSGPWLERLIVQRNKIHHPTYGSNSWSDGHPAGPNGILFHECGGGHVFRYNEFYSEWGRYFMDAIGGEENFSTKGMPNADTDIYGNVLRHAWDDAIEAEGANRNVRIWGNYMDQTTTGVASTTSHMGPIYIFRNVYNRSRMLSSKSYDDDSRNVFFKSGTADGYGGGRRYVFHNTMLQAPPPKGTTYPLGGGGGLVGPGGGQPLTNTVSRNNIFHIWKTWWQSIDTRGGGGNDFDYDLFNGNVSAYSGAESHGIVGVPVYRSGHGWSSDDGGLYQLEAASPGYDKGVRLPNFNDSFTGSAPDMGAHEAGMPAMKFGIN